LIGEKGKTDEKPPSKPRIMISAKDVEDAAASGAQNNIAHGGSDTESAHEGGGTDMEDVHDEATRPEEHNDTEGDEEEEGEILEEGAEEVADEASPTVQTATSEFSLDESTKEAAAETEDTSSQVSGDININDIGAALAGLKRGPAPTSPEEEANETPKEKKIRL
jgi:hypothetical protein